METKTPQKPSLTPPASTEDRLRKIERLTHFLDDSLKIPGTNYRVGWDAVIGLIPGLGDVASAALSAYVIYQAHQVGTSKWVLSRMVGNVVLDSLVGAIPIVGDAFDAVWKSNRRNARLLKRHFNQKK